MGHKKTFIIASGIAVIILILIGSAWYYEAHQSTPSGNWTSEKNQAAPVTQAANSQVNFPNSNPNSNTPSGTSTSPTAQTKTENNLGSFSIAYSSSSQISWYEDESKLSLTQASIASDTLSLNLTIVTGNNGACIPLDLRIVPDKNGQSNTVVPIADQFPFEYNNTCRKIPNITYTNQIVSFSVGSTTFPLVLTTGGERSTDFEVATTTAGGMSITQK